MLYVMHIFFIVKLFIDKDNNCMISPSGALTGWKGIFNENAILNAEMV
jgi:hypothetical protein